VTYDALWSEAKFGLTTLVLFKYGTLYRVKHKKSNKTVDLRAYILALVNVQRIAQISSLLVTNSIKQASISQEMIISVESNA
jgi:hypothetical protein